PGTLLARAGEALGQARASDGAMLRFAHPGNVAPLDLLGADLHHAIERGEIDIVFQPQVSIKTGRITGVEALARWRHPTLGPLGADPLFAAAERADLGLALSDHIQQIALQRAAHWPTSLSHLRLSINVTAADVARAGFVQLFLDRVAASGFPLEQLTVEIIETGLIVELDRAARVLDQLRGAGVRVAIDDFGTGYSSLVYLTGLPVDYIKIDRALVSHIDGADRERIVVRGVIQIAGQLGLGIVAEGVETAEQAHLLGQLGCETYQGFLRAGGLEEDALVAMVEEEIQCAA
ncbi:EAL domain-containing protein, partial [Sphingomonas sp. NPDC019816]|uniref:EAL domain-containing protein n=1 Tax=Sphingomonas sp. NPDC019816 TaxID=3390679 RepID=UPI003D049F15